MFLYEYLDDRAIVCGLDGTALTEDGDSFSTSSTEHDVRQSEFVHRNTVLQM